MNSYKHTQIGYLMIVVLIIVATTLTWSQIVVRNEPPSADSGANFLMTMLSLLIIIILLSFTTLTTYIDEKYLHVKFGFGIFKKKFLLDEIATVNQVTNHWYYGWGIRMWWRPKMRIYNVSGLKAVEITLKNGEIYRIGTDTPEELEMALKQIINSPIK